MDKIEICSFKKQMKNICKWIDIDFDNDHDNIPAFVMHINEKYNINLKFEGHGKEYNMHDKIIYDKKRIDLCFNVEKGILKTCKKNGVSNFQPLISFKKDVIVCNDQFILHGKIHDMSHFNNDSHDDVEYYGNDASIKSTKTALEDYERFTSETNDIVARYFNKYNHSRKATTIMKKIVYDHLGMVKLDKIQLDEYNMIQKTTIGPLLYGDKKTVKNHHMYDINSSYPYILQAEGFMFPTKIGRHCKLNKVSGYGFFHVKLLNQSAINYKLFKTNDDEWYTHIDIKILDMNNYSYELYDGEFNAYIYDDECLLSSKLIFGKIINDLYELKNKGNKYAKRCLNSLWGISCWQKTQTVNLTPENLEIYDEVIKLIHPIKKTIDIVNKEQPFTSSYARIKPFLLAQARFNISCVIKKVLDYDGGKYDVCRVHTDSIMTNMEPKQFATIARVDDCIGNWKTDDKIDPKKSYLIKNCLFVNELN